MSYLRKFIILARLSYSTVRGDLLPAGYTHSFTPADYCHLPGIRMRSVDVRAYVSAW